MRVPIISFIHTGIERTEDEGFPDPADVCAEVEFRFQMAGMVLIVDLQIDVNVNESSGVN